MNTLDRNTIAFFPDTPLWRRALLGLLIILALGVRVIELQMPPYDFHPTRQYWSALLARAFYLESRELAPDWQRDVAQASRARIGALEPPVFEFSVAQLYKLIGREVLWIPRLFSILFWLVGGVFIFLIGIKLGSLDAAVLAAGFFLFVPFGIKASRSFQPDNLMLMLLICTLYLLLHYHDKPGWRRLLWAGAVGGLATVVKPQGFFMLAITAFSLMGYQGRQKRSRVLIFLTLVSLPALFYYGRELLVNQAMENQVRSSFVPGLWFKLVYWQFWLKHLWRVVGFSALVGGMLGILFAPAGWRRNFLAGMWLGYVIFGLFYTYHIHTHDYYHLQFIPAVALALGLMGAVVLQQLVLINQNWLWRTIIGCVLLFSVFLNIGLYLNTLSEAGNSPLQTQLATQIGVLVKHSTRTVFLAPYYGYPLQYHGELAGEAWPTVGDINSGQLWGEQPLTAPERFEQFYQRTLPEYFIITDMAEYSAQTDLQRFLTERFPVIKQSADFIIFDLRQR
jgi:hypothetical protein